MNPQTVPADSIQGSANLQDLLSSYFDRDVAQRAAKSLSNGAEVEVVIQDSARSESFTFTREGGRNKILAQPPKAPQVQFTIQRAALDELIADPSDDIGAIGVAIMKKMAPGADPSKKISFSLKSGFFTLFTKGYLGVVTAGGSGFASYLASRGMNGMGAIKAAIKKAKGE